MVKVDSLEIKQRIKESAPRVAKAIREAAKNSANEAQFAMASANIIRDFADPLGIELELLVEHQVVTGRIDALYNRLVIEYERPNSLTERNTYSTNRGAIDQVKRYITDLSEQERRAKKRFAGVATDGNYYIFIRFIDGAFRIDESPLKVTSRTTELFLEYLATLAIEKPLTADNLIKDFGVGTDIANSLVQVFYDVVTSKMEARAEAIFGQWAENFSEACDYETGIAHAKRTVLQKSAAMFGIDEKSPRPLPLFFSIHTYFAIIIKLIALQMATIHRYRRRPRNLLREMAEHGFNRLRDRLAEVEKGDVFDRLGIKNFLEADFFSWYVDNWNGNMADALSGFISAMYRYDLPSAETQPDEYRDILKEIYQNIMPKELRHNLGEYYTPDWLVERILNQLGYNGDPKVRILDPACGSGTFLYHEVRRVRQKGFEEYAPEDKLLRSVLSNIVGFDLNPVAVITARTSYLLALGDLLDYQDEDIFLPVYTADSIMTPHQGKVLEEAGALVMETTVGEFRIPEKLTALPDLHRFTEYLSLHVQNRLEPDRFVEKCEDRFEGLSNTDLGHIRFTYERILELERKGKNRIWGAIIKNMFAPVFARKFDLIAGNPPWINWQHLPERYRQNTKGLWFEYGLFPHTGMDTILGKGKKDISTLMTYVAMDKYLKKGGKLGFVITQSVFKTGGAGQGFRRFKLGDREDLKVVYVDDMVELKPFPGVGNRTAIMVLEKGRKTKYPVPYQYWKKTKKGVSLKPDMTLEEVSELTRRLRLYAQPVSAEDATSAWMTCRKRALSAAEKVLGKSDYKAHAGVYSGGANGVFWVDIVSERPDGLLVIRNMTEGIKRPVPDVEAVLEPDLVYPLLRGRDVKRWHAEPSAYIIMVQDPKKRRGIDEDIMKDRYPHTYAYLKQFEDILRERKSQPIRNLMEKGPFYSMFAVGDYTFAPWKVVWPWISQEFIIATISTSNKKPVLPEHNVSLYTPRDEKESYFLAGLLNSSIIGFTVRAFYSGGGGGLGAPSTLMKLNIKDYSRDSKDHSNILKLSKKAHELTAYGDFDKLPDIEAEIDERVAHLYGITDVELKEMQKSLRELVE